MKPKTPELLKFKRLSRRLGEGVRGTVGLLELLWVGTSKNCPEGDVGRFSNEEIAVMCDWEGNADELVAALLETGWLDACPEYRLVVHDWHDHAPNYVKGNMKRHKKEFALASSPGNLPSNVPSSLPDDAPSLPLPSLPSPPPPKADPAWEAVVVELHGEGMGRSQSAVRTARENGCDPGAVLALLEHFRSKKPAWETGALYARILELRPEQAPETLWPPASKCVVLAQKSAKRAEEQAELERRKAEEQAAQKAEDRRWRDLEKKHKEAISKMTDATIRRVIETRAPDEASMLLRNGVKRPLENLVRTVLIEHLESTP
jgi:hypothetical protein